MIAETVRRPAIALLCAAQFVVVLDATIVAVALPDIGRDLGLSGTALSWVLSAYTLVFGGFLMLMGRAADLLGRRRVLIAGFAVFGGASLACGLAGGPATLIGARVVQGLGAAAISPAALALLTDGTAEGRARSRALAAWTGAAAGGGALGWVAGGAIADGPGWPWVFLVNVVPCAVAIVLALRRLPGDGAREAGRRLDVAGAVSATAGLALLVLGLTRAEQAAPGDPSAWGSLLASAALLALFARIERRPADPLLPPGTLAQPRLAAGLLASAAITTVSTGPLFVCVLYLQNELELPATETGLLFAPFNLAVIAGSVAGARLLDAGGERRAGAAGLLAIGAGGALLLLLPAAGAPVVLPAFLLMGIGVGCGAVAATAAGTEAVERERRGVASGLLNTAAQIGNALGLSVFVVLASAASGGADAGLRLACVTAAAVAAAGAAAFAALQRRG
jgi:MFS family permease